MEQVVEVQLPVTRWPPGADVASSADELSNLHYGQLWLQGSTTSFRTPAPEPEVKEGRNYYYCIIIILASM